MWSPIVHTLDVLVVCVAVADAFVAVSREWHGDLCLLSAGLLVGYRLGAQLSGGRTDGALVQMLLLGALSFAVEFCHPAVPAKAPAAGWLGNWLVQSAATVLLGVGLAISGWCVCVASPPICVAPPPTAAARPTGSGTALVQSSPAETGCSADELRSELVSIYLRVGAPTEKLEGLDGVIQRYWTAEQRRHLLNLVRLKYNG
jgi:hypothetical protein